MTGQRVQMPAPSLIPRTPEPAAPAEMPMPEGEREAAMTTEGPAQEAVPLETTQAPEVRVKTTQAEATTLKPILQEPVKQKDTEPPEPDLPKVTPLPFDAYEMPQIDMPTAEEMQDQGAAEIAGRSKLFQMREAEAGAKMAVRQRG